MIEATVTCQRNADRDTYEFTIEISGLNVKLAAQSSNACESLAHFAAEAVAAEIERVCLHEYSSSGG